MEKNFYRGTFVPQAGEAVNDVRAVNKRIAMEREAGIVEIDSDAIEEMDRMTLEELESLAEKYARDIERIKEVRNFVVKKIEEKTKKMSN